MEKNGRKNTMKRKEKIVHKILKFQSIEKWVRISKKDKVIFLDKKGKKSMIKQSCKVTLGQGKSFGGTCQEKVSLISAYE